MQHVQSFIPTKTLTWEALIAEVSTHDGLTPLLDLAKTRQAEGQDAQLFVNECMQVFTAGTHAETLNKVFDRSRANGGGMNGDQIDVARFAIERGMTAEQAYLMTGHAAEKASSDGAAVYIPVLEALCKAESEAEGDESCVWGDNRDVITEKLIGRIAGDERGAALQLAVAMECAELVRGCSTQGDRDHFHDRFETLMRSALQVAGRALPDTIWHAYVGGERQPPSVATDERLFLNMERECLLLIEQMGKAEGEELDRLYEHAAALDELICRHEGRGAVVAEVKLRRLQCPTWGITRQDAKDTFGREWPLAVRTALAALTGENSGVEPLSPAEILTRLRGCGVEVRADGFHFPSGCHGAAPFLLRTMTKEQAEAVMALARQEAALAIAAE